MPLLKKEMPLLKKKMPLLKRELLLLMKLMKKAYQKNKDLRK
jgi:hypothetical protein